MGYFHVHNEIFGGWITSLMKFINVSYMHTNSLSILDVFLLFYVCYMYMCTCMWEGSTDACMHTQKQRRILDIFLCHSPALTQSFSLNLMLILFSFNCTEKPWNSGLLPVLFPMLALEARMAMANFFIYRDRWEGFELKPLCSGSDSFYLLSHLPNPSGNNFTQCLTSLHI